MRAVTSRLTRSLNHGSWVETWDSTNLTAQGGRLPLAVEIKIVLANVPPENVVAMFEAVPR